MRRPSAKVLPNRCDLYRNLGGQDPDAGATAEFRPIAFDVRCAAQLEASGQEYRESAAAYRQVDKYRIMFDRDYSLQPRDKIELTDSTPPLMAFVDGTLDNAGRGGAFTVLATRVS